MKFIKAHPKFAAVVLVIIAVLFLILYWERSKVLKNRQELAFPNAARNGEIQVDTFYSDQLTAKELNVYDQLIGRLEDLKGGVVAFSEPLTGTEYIRILSAVENEHDYFYGFYDIPMSAENIYMKHTDRDLTSVKKAEISKTILFLSCALDVNKAGEYGKDGTVTNLLEVEQSLSENDPEKVKKIKDMQEQTEEKITEILAQIPEGAGEWDALSYFLDWMDQNLTLYTELGEAAYSFTTMDEVFGQAYLSNNPACILNGQATMLGYTKLLSLLCRRAGMPSHLIMGTWGTYAQEGYTMCVVELSGEKVYVDASGMKASSFSGIQCLKEQEALSHMKPVPYFNYS